MNNITEEDKVALKKAQIYETIEPVDLLNFWASEQIKIDLQCKKFDYYVSVLNSLGYEKIAPEIALELMQMNHFDLVGNSDDGEESAE